MKARALGFQTSLFGGDEIPVGAVAPVLAFDPASSTNAQRVLDLARLGYLPEPVLDPTYGTGGMWSLHQPDRLVATDIDAERGLHVQCSYLALPFVDDAFASCLFDPPYKLTGDTTEVRRGGHGDLAHRFATKMTRRAWSSVELAMAECARVTRDVLIVKCQDQIETGGYVWQVGQVLRFAEDVLGWRCDGQLHLMNYVMQPDGRPQKHIRNNYSTFVCLIPDRRRR